MESSEFPTPFGLMVRTPRMMSWTFFLKNLFLTDWREFLEVVIFGFFVVEVFFFLDSIH